MRERIADGDVALTDTARHAVEVADRLIARHQRTIASSTGTFGGIVETLRAGQTPVTVVTVWNRRHRGVIVDVGMDHVVIDRGASVVAVRLQAIATVLGGTSRVATEGRPPSRSPITLGERLERWSAHLPVAVCTGGRDPLRGHIVVVGDDVVSLAPMSPRAEPACHLPLVAVVEVHLDASAERALDGHPPATSHAESVKTVTDLPDGQAWT